MREKGHGKPPFLFRETSVSVNERQKPDGQQVSYPGLAICLNGINWESAQFDPEMLKDDFIAELGLVLTEINLRSLYPQTWEGRQAATLRTIGKG